jgi:hypothetical protein
MHRQVVDPTPTYGPAVEVLVREKLIAVVPEQPAVTRMLANREWAFAPDGRGGLRRRRRPLRHGQVDGIGRQCMPIGLLQRLLRVLAAAGARVELVDERGRAPWPRPDLDALGAAGGREADFLWALLENDHGQVVVRHPGEVAGLLELIGQLYPEASVLVIAAARRAAWRIWRELARRRGEPIGLVAGPANHKGRLWRVVTVVGSNDSLRRRWDVVIFPDLAEACADSAAPYLALLTARRVYGFVTAGRRPPLSRPLRAEGLAGPVIFDTRAPGPPVRVAVVGAPAARVPADATALDRRRRAVWRNGRRNGLVARLAGDLALRPAAALAGLGVTPPDGLGGRADGLRVAVLVESREHGRVLLQRLPGWRLLHAGPEKDGATPDAGPEAGASVGTVVTLAHAAVQGVAADVLLNAAGTAAPLIVTGFPPPDLDGGQGAVLVDVADAFDAAARHDVHLRIAEYERHGWKVTDRDAAEPLSTNLPGGPLAARGMGAPGAPPAGPAPR